jgi:hypothetical protein
MAGGIYNTFNGTRPALFGVRLRRNLGFNIGAKSSRVVRIAFELTRLELWWLLAIIGQQDMEDSMNGLIYLVGLVVVILAVLSFFGLR